MALVLLFSSAAWAQDKSAAETKKKRKHLGKVEKEYERATNQTKLKFPIFPITCVQPGACIFFSLETSFTGTKPEPPPEQFLFALYIFTKTLQPFADTTLYARVDGEVINLGEMTYAGQSSKDGLTGMAYGINLNLQEVAKLAQAKKVEMRIGGLQFPLGENEINAIWDLHNQATLSQ
jgi:hypothetical protein